MADFMLELHRVHNFGKVIHQACCFLFLFFILSRETIAQTNQSGLDIDSAGLIIEAVIGWDGYVDPATPVPVSFLIRNDTGRNIEGVLRLSDMIDGQEIELGSVMVAPGSTRRFVYILSITSWFDWVASLSHLERKLWRRELVLTSGTRFDGSVNWILFVDEGGRNLSLPGALTDKTLSYSRQLPVAEPNGRPIRCLTAKPWQIPNHPGPLNVALAMVFPEGAPEREMNQVQWRAVAEWMCQGGNIFVHKDSVDIINRLTDSAPLATEVPISSGRLLVRKFGLGAIYEYDSPLLASVSGEIRQAIARVAGELGRNAINRFSDLGHFQIPRSGKADRNRVIIGVFFVLYMLLSGVGSLLLFRLNQRQIALFIITVVIGSSAASAVLGGFLRIGNGDLNWLTVTQAGVGGLVQVGTIEVQSAGGSNTRVAIQGEHSDLQFIGKEEMYEHDVQQRIGYAPFTWRPNAAAVEDNCFQINVPVSPWGRRRCHASAFLREIRRMDFELEFERQDPSTNDQQTQIKSFDLTEGLFSLTLVNHLPINLKDCWLFIGVTKITAQQSDARQFPPQANLLNRSLRIRYRDDSPEDISVALDGLIDVYHSQRVPDLASGETRNIKFKANFQAAQTNRELAELWPGGSPIPPKLSRFGTSSAWIIGRMDRSPIITIDEKHTDFVPYKSVHLFIQEIFSEDMPDIFNLSGIVEEDKSDLDPQDSK